MVVQAVLGAGMAVLVLLLARMLPPRWAVGAAVACCLHPGAMDSPLFLMTEVLFTALLVGVVAALAFGQALAAVSQR